MRQVLLHPAFWTLVVVAITINPCWYFLNDWMPKYMVRTHQTGYLAAGLFTVPIFLAADAGNLLSGGLIKWLTRRGWPLSRAQGATLSVAAVMILPVAAVPELTSPYLVVCLLALGALGVTFNRGQLHRLPTGFLLCQRGHGGWNPGDVEQRVRRAGPALDRKVRRSDP